MEDLQLYRVSPTGRITLGDLLQGVELAQAKKNADGTITVKPVNIVDPGRRNTITNLPGEEPLPGVE